MLIHSSFGAITAERYAIRQIIIEVEVKTCTLLVDFYAVDGTVPFHTQHYTFSYEAVTPQAQALFGAVSGMARAYVDAQVGAK